MSLRKEKKSVVVKLTPRCIFYVCKYFFFSHLLAIRSDNVRPYTFESHETLKSWIEGALESESEWENEKKSWKENFLSKFSNPLIVFLSHQCTFGKLLCLPMWKYSTMKIAKGGKIMMEWMWKISARPRMHSSTTNMSIFHQSSVA